MKWTEYLLPTLKEDPQEAEAVSHKLMVRAGLIRRITAGAYAYLPLGYKVLRKVENIIRDEMDKAGALQMLMPALQPVDLWHKSGRYNDIGDVMIKFKDRHKKEIALGPTHEEVITYIASNEIRSYKDLPRTLYQIQTKFRDELRPRFGIVRSCEFIMKDAYSFDIDDQSLDISYEKMFNAYCRIFERCGVSYIPVEADAGLMGGKVSHEFMVPSDIGEDKIALCEACGYAASAEIMPAISNQAISQKEISDIQEVATPGYTAVDEVCNFLKVDHSNIIKTLMYITEDGPKAILIRGDYEVNEVKLSNVLNSSNLRLADEKEILLYTGGPIGFTGPVGLVGVKVYADKSLTNVNNAVSGSNISDTHLLNVNLDRDVLIHKWVDVRTVVEGDLCPQCNEQVKVKNAIEIGHTFKLGTKYSERLGAQYLNEKSKTVPAVMGCYGIGVNRILAAVIENSHDDYGIIWPENLTPFKIIIISLNMDDHKVRDVSTVIYDRLLGNNIEVLWDDRQQKTAGVKFKDADLVGFQIQIIVGKKNLQENMVEIKVRATGEKTKVSIDNIHENLDDILKNK